MGPSVQRADLQLLETPEQVVDSFEADRLLFQSPYFGALYILLQNPTPENKLQTIVYFVPHF